MSNPKVLKGLAKARQVKSWKAKNDPEYKKKLRKHAKKHLNSKEAIAKRSRKYFQSEEFSKLVSERNKQMHADGRFKDPFKDDFDVVVRERPNDYAGVLEEKDYAEM